MLTDSYDIFELMDVNLSLPVKKMADIALETKLGVFNINGIIPQLNRVYNGSLYNVQVSPA